MSLLRPGVIKQHTQTCRFPWLQLRPVRSRSPQTTKRTATMEPSQLSSLDISSFRPIMHSTQHLMPPPSKIPPNHAPGPSSYVTGPSGHATGPSSHVPGPSNHATGPSNHSLGPSKLTTSGLRSERLGNITNTKLPLKTVPSNIANDGSKSGALGSVTNSKAPLKPVPSIAAKCGPKSGVSLTSTKPLANPVTNLLQKISACGSDSNNCNTLKSSDDVTASQGTYSRDQIEQKRLEALKKRRNRLKLNAPTNKKWWVIALYEWN